MVNTKKNNVIKTVADLNQQSDWLEGVNTEIPYIKNKPDLSTANDDLNDLIQRFDDYENNVVTGSGVARTFASLSANGSMTQTSTIVTLVFSAPIPGLIFDDIKISGIANLNFSSLSTTDNITYTFNISGFTSSGPLTVEVTKDGYQITGALRTCFVYHTVNAVLNNLTANGTSQNTTTQLTLFFGSVISGLNASNIIITTTQGITKGTLTNNGSIYYLPINNVTQNENITVTVSMPGYTINNSSQTVNIFFASLVNFTNLAVNGNVNNTTTQITLTFDNAIPLVASDVILSGVAGAIVTSISGSGNVWVADISGFNYSGMLSVRIQKTGFNVVGTLAEWIYFIHEVQFLVLSANGGNNLNSTLLTIELNRNIDGLNSNDVTISHPTILDIDNRIKGVLTYVSLGRYTLTINTMGLDDVGEYDITVSINKNGFSILPFRSTKIFKVINFPYNGLAQNGNTYTKTTEVYTHFGSFIPLGVPTHFLLSGVPGLVWATNTSGGGFVHTISDFITNFNSNGNLTVRYSRAYYIPTPDRLTVPVFGRVERILLGVSQNGTSTVNTSQLVLDFDWPVLDLTASDISITTTVSGLTLTLGIPVPNGDSTRWTVPVTYISPKDGDINISVNKPGYDIKGIPATIKVFGVIQVTYYELTVNGNATETTTQLILRMSYPIPESLLTLSIFTIAGSGFLTPARPTGLLTIGSYIFINVTDIWQAGNISVSINEFIGGGRYQISPLTRNSATFYFAAPPQVQNVQAIVDPVTPWNKINITWNLLNEADLGYTIRWGLTSTNLNNVIQINNKNTTSYSHMGLNQLTDYYYTVEGRNNSGSGPRSSPVAHAKTHINKPSMPQGNVTATGYYSLNVNITPANPSSEQVTLYTIYTSSTSSTPIYSSPTAPCTHSISGLVSGSYYSYWISAWNSSGESDRRHIQGQTTQIPAPPMFTGCNLRITGTTTTSISLAWNAASGSVSSYYVYVDGVHNKIVTTTSTTITVFTYKSYKFTVKAYGPGGFSNELCETNGTPTYVPPYVPPVDPGCPGCGNTSGHQPWCPYNPKPWEEPKPAFNLQIPYIVYGRWEYTAKWVWFFGKREYNKRRWIHVNFYRQKDWQDKVEYEVWIKCVTDDTGLLVPSYWEWVKKPTNVLQGKHFRDMVEYEQVMKESFNINDVNYGPSYNPSIPPLEKVTYEIGWPINQTYTFDIWDTFNSDSLASIVGYKLSPGRPVVGPVTYSDEMTHYEFWKGHTYEIFVRAYEKGNPSNFKDSPKLYYKFTS